MSPIISMIAGAASSAWKTVAGALTAFSDNFNRTTSGSLGTSSSGNLWTALKGVWFADGAAAKTTDAASTYPIANIEMSSASITSSISTGSIVTLSSTGTVGSITSGPTAGFFEATITGMSTTTGFAVGQWIAATNGTGSLYGGTPDYVEITQIVNSTSLKYRTKGGTTPTAGSVTNIQTRNSDGGSGIALWITDSGNWWGVSYGRAIDNSCNCSTCQNSYCNTYTNYSSSYCGGYTNYASSYCGGYTNYASYSCNAYQNYTSYGCNGYANYASYSCNSYTNYASYSCNGYGFSASSGCLQYSNFPTYNCIGWTQSYSCSSYSQSISSYGCDFYQKTGSGFTSGNWTCVEYGPRYTSSCNGWSSSYSCSSTNMTWAYSCDSPFTTYSQICNSYSASWSPGCSGYSSSWSPSCNSYTSFIGPGCSSYSVGYFPSCSGGTYTVYSPSCSGGTYTVWSPSCSSTTYGYIVCNCQTCYPPYIRLFKSVSNAVSEVTRWTLGSMSAAFKVITNAATKTITIRPYKEVSMTTQIGSDLTSTQSTATMETKFGIVLSPSDYVQGSTADDFNITSN